MDSGLVVHQGGSQEMEVVSLIMVYEDGKGRERILKF